MEMELFHRIIDDAALTGVKRIALFLHGEPMLHPQIIEMIGYIKSKKLTLNLRTNGMAFSEKKIKKILDCGVNSADYISFSVLGNSKEVHEKLMKKGNYDRIVQNILTFLSLRRKKRMNGPIIEIYFQTTRENIHEIENFKHKWRGVVDHARVSGSTSESFAEYKREGKNIPLRTHSCSRLWQTMTVLWNGDITLCSHDLDGDWLLGNLNVQSISEIWNNKQLLAIKKIHKEKQFEKIPFCLKCDM
jgi:radical SAM protein with 4Fe4S-binding SPASM domain